MNRLMNILEPLKDYAKAHPYILGVTTVLGLMILFLRKIHYRFIVYPDVQGRFNQQNPFGYKHPNNRGMKSQDIEVVSEEKVTLRGWYITQKQPQHLVLYYHENAGNIGGRLYFIQELMSKIKANVLIVAYRGFSDSDGRSPPNEKQIMTDSKAIMEKAIELSKRDKLSLIVFGRSLGGASSINTLSQPTFKYAAKGLILENTFTSIKDVAWNLTPKPLSFLYPLIWLVTAGSYNSVSKIHNVHIPILFIKGCKDELIPKVQMDKLHNVYQGLKRENFDLEVRAGTHNDTWIRGGEDYFLKMKEFMEYCSKL